MPGLFVVATVSCMVAPGRVDDLVVALLYLDGDAELEVVHAGGGGNSSARTPADFNALIHTGLIHLNT